eukprot:2340910-Amphidinium_carterae.1
MPCRVAGRASSGCLVTFFLLKGLDSRASMTPQRTRWGAGEQRKLAAHRWLMRGGSCLLTSKSNTDALSSCCTTQLLVDQQLSG